MKKLFFILSIVTLVTSCGSKNSEGEVAKTDSLKTDSSVVTVDSVAVDTTSVDTVVVK